PNVTKAVLTGDTSEMHRTICMSRGAELFLAKPQSRVEWQQVFASLNEIGRFQPQEGFRGVLRRVGLQDVLQMECLSRNSALLEITTKELRGLIYIFEGQIIHAEAGDRNGTEAFNFLMGLTGGEFSQRPYTAPPQQTITDSWEFLLMEAARMRDETAGEPTAPEDAIMPPLRYAAPIEDEAQAPIFQPAPSMPEPGPSAAPRPQWQPPQPRRPVRPPPESQTHYFTRPPAPNSIDAQQPEVAEFIIISSQGDVLYEWRCHDVNARVNFLEFLSQKARLLSQGLPIGHFERFEIFGSKSRIITQLEHDHAVFVRTNVATDSSIREDNS
ncbi:MAG: DUF4388 domain-containing protein, partial [Phycisphaerales bacterium]|nr:DUF4388 domain-containing protein [Phycisphaerales bacterium]